MIFFLFLLKLEMSSLVSVKVIKQFIWGPVADKLCCGGNAVLRGSYHSSRSSVPCQRCVHGPCGWEWVPRGDSLLQQRRPAMSEHACKRTTDECQMNHSRLRIMKTGTRQNIFNKIWAQFIIKLSINKKTHHHLQLDVQLLTRPKDGGFGCGGRGGGGTGRREEDGKLWRKCFLK